MSNGWHCEACERFFAESIVHTKITVELEPRDYAAPTTYCSFACLDEHRATPEIHDLVDRPEHPVKVRFHIAEQRYVEGGPPPCE